MAGAPQFLMKLPPGRPAARGQVTEGPKNGALPEAGQTASKVESLWAEV